MAGNIYFNIGSSGTQAEIAYVANSVNYPTLLPSVSGAGYAGVDATGTDTNIDIKLSAKGSGVVDLGTQTSGSAGGAAGYMVIKVSGNTYKVPLYSV